MAVRVPGVRYARANKVPAALLLFGLVIALGAAKRGALPDAQRTAGLLIAAVLVVGATAVVPDLVVAFLAALLFVFAISEEAVITNAAQRLMALLNGSAASVSRIGGHQREAA